ncbi:hypothetical protein FACS189474_2230 [Bacteroidia bacterium]|nr:hypothetical protein FACS189474_2230 [Bacteroidia bacterium]
MLAFGQGLSPIPSTTPSQYQQQQIDRKYGMFIHFGVNTFQDEEWTDGSKPATSYQPATIDAKQWVQTAKNAGMKYIILVTKHHDGFCLWDSKYTTYDVAASGNKTNVVEAVAKECKKQGIRLGLYYSLWDRKENPDTENEALDEAYNQYMINQLNELMDITSKYTPIVEFWFDGSWAKKGYRWNFDKIYQTIKSREPQCQIGINWTIGKPDSPDEADWQWHHQQIYPDKQKEGDLIRYFPSDFRLGDPYLPATPDPKLFTHEGKSYYMPWESTVCMSQKWFYNTTDTAYKSIDELVQLYRTATAQDNILILNCPPGRDGKMREKDSNLLIELRKRIEEVHLSDYVNPFIGASTNTASSYHGLGKTFPGAATPFGMTQVSPNTITGGDNGSGYSYEHITMEGFAFTQMSGVGWYGDLGNFLVLPTIGEEATFPHYDKATETAKAGYYSVLLTDYNIKAEATAAPHSGMLRFTFPENKQSRIRIDLARRVGGVSDYQYLQVVNDSTIRGYMICTPKGGGWGHGAGNPDYTVYFYAQFSRPFITGKRELKGENLKFFAGFPTHKDEVITLKTGISFVDMEGAEKNFKAEMTDRSFDEVRAAARRLWDEALSKISVTGGTDEQKTIFYTALYHTMIDPRMFSDVDGRYWGGDKQAHISDKFHKRTIFSGWDVFRSQFPLQTIINPVLVNDQINSFISLAEENGTGYYDRWEFLNAYSGCMIGNPFLSVLADAYQKGIRDYDMEKAYQYALNTSKKFGNGNLGYTPSPDYSISSTLEYAYTDWCMSVLAKALNKQADANYFAQRANAYQKVFDKDKGWFRPKLADGSWEEWPEDARTHEWYGCIESNPYQQGWFVPHDVGGMVDLMGGETKALADLTNFFEQAPEDLLWNQYYNHANEPVHHIPFLFNRLHAPQRTQKWTRHICEKAYHNSVEGLVGNEDVGQMSAWYVLAAAGIHPVCPGETTYEITSPVFDTITFNLDNGKTFTIEAKNNSAENIYIQTMKLNGKKHKSYQINHEDIVKGGKLVLTMGK